MYIKAAEIGELVPNGMKPLVLDGHEVVLCNNNGTYYAVERRCGHMSAPMDLGTLNGHILTCPLHNAQYSIVSGEALSGPTARAPREPDPKDVIPHYLDLLMSNIRTNDLRTYPVKVENGWVLIDMDRS